ncbi:hypothetical protein N665_0155s0002 [Sinapis alba]|nr:hypothetical protein N665_0155s0002 [Sinapis alba]
MQNQTNRRGRIHFAELQTGGLRAHWHLLKARFPCKNCKVKLSYRSSTGRTVKCPCCSSWRPMPSLKTLVCGGCNATIIYQKDDRSVKCYPCKHITNLQETNDGVSSFFQFVPLPVNGVGPSEGDWVICQEVNRVVPPQTNRVIPPQVNPVNPSIVNRAAPQNNPLIPHQVNRIVHPQVNRVIPPQVNWRNRKANAETESTATSPFTPNSESESTSAFVADYVARLVKDYAPGMRGNKREVEEEDKTEPKNKKTGH